MRAILILVMAAAMAASSCGLLNAALGVSGTAPNANTPEAKQAAKKVDEDILDWLTWILVGGGTAAGGAVAENRRQRRKQKKAAAATDKK